MAWILENSPLSIRKGDAKFLQVQTRGPIMFTNVWI
jgi:hypothetical protein